MICVFCGIVAGREPAQILRVWPDAIAIRPLAPITPDHVLVIPHQHVADATTDPEVTARAARRAAEIARPGQHITVNIGGAAGQTVCHLHWHVFTCLGGDRCMPWGCPTTTLTSQEALVTGRPITHRPGVVYQATTPTAPHMTGYIGNLDQRPPHVVFEPFANPDEWTIRGLPLDELPALPLGARRLVHAADAAGQMWALTLRDVPSGTRRHGHLLPQVEIDLPAFDPGDIHAGTRWSWVNGRIDYDQYSHRPLLLRDAMARLTLTG
ncbi:HIT family protein [Nocardiopsis alba]|uniref:HIT family protein n=1 Tax=Nocardiopsis alba TaxID=53437 RepID=UPI00366CDE36